ncbi:MAG: DUF899 family protein [Pseudomonadales bacterium]
MTSLQTREKLKANYDEIMRLRGEIRELTQADSPEEVEDYAFTGQAGGVRLAELFGDKTDLIVIHNMGASCSYCTLWADGFNGVVPHLEDRAAFVVISPDAPEAQAKFAESRGWKFKMLSHQGTSFAEDMGYKSEQGFEPGISVFQKRDGKVVRVSDRPMGPGDDFCAIWHMFDLIPEGANGWQPQYNY